MILTGWHISVSSLQTNEYYMGYCVDLKAKSVVMQKMMHTSI